MVTTRAELLRRLAHWGSSRGPEWFVRYSPAVVGCAAALAAPEARRNIRRSLVEVRGARSPARDAVDVLRTFSAYAGSLAESLARGSDNDGPIVPVIRGAPYIREVLSDGRGFVVGTLHSGGWDVIGKLLSGPLAREVLLVMEREPDGAARAFHDEIRERGGVRVAHVGGGDALASLPLLSHLRGGGVVAAQLDRLAPGMRARPVRLFDRDGALPEGPLLLARLAGVPLLPIFCARLGFRRYLLHIERPVRLARRATPADIDAAAQRVADAMTGFLRAHPTQWFRFS
ncbi:MAG: lysophospholipid acyltransferase family protein [Polyangiaceae bacterium]